MKLLSKKIERSKKGQKNSAYIKNVMAYITAPEDQAKGEKCVYYEGLNFLTSTPRDHTTEMQFLCDAKIGADQLSPVSHWIISWEDKGGVRLRHDNMIQTAKDFLAYMGYTHEHLASIAIHADTSHDHIHIAACRISTETGRMLAEGRGWWKRESKKFDLMQSQKMGWDVADGVKALFSPSTKATKKKPPRLRRGAKRFEQRTGQVSTQRTMQETLTDIQKDLQSNMKWGDFHKILAEKGIICELAEHGKRQGLKYTDGKNYEKPSALGDFWNLKNLEAFFGKRFRKPRKAAYDLAKKARLEQAHSQAQEVVKKAERHTFAMNRRCLMRRRRDERAMIEQHMMHHQNNIENDMYSQTM